MKKVTIKTKDYGIKEGYRLSLVGDFPMGRTDNSCSLVLIPPNRKDGETCPCIVFAKYKKCKMYSFEEIGKYPYINLDSKKDMTQLMDAYKESMKK